LPCGNIQGKNVCAQLTRNLKNLLALWAYTRTKCMCPVHEEFKKSTCPAGVYKNKNVCAQFMRNLKKLLVLRAYIRKIMYVPNS
jgi:hypothetical protein